MTQTGKRLRLFAGMLVIAAIVFVICFPWSTGVPGALEKQLAAITADPGVHEFTIHSRSASDLCLIVEPYASSKAIQAALPPGYALSHSAEEKIVSQAGIRESFSVAMLNHGRLIEIEYLPNSVTTKESCVAIPGESVFSFLVTRHPRESRPIEISSGTLPK